MPDIVSVIVVTAALVGAFAALSFLATLPRQLDLLGARPHRFTGVVTQIAYSQRPKRLVYLRVDAHRVDVSLLTRYYPWLRIGRSVSLTYREGKSGRWYAEAVEKLPDEGQGR